ncbi:MAG: hypothetical protein U5R48_05080 [Gammaproteobacteria bacterium]|nr:hypothetical protein [Gammaproteobacteria bacterium]
MRDDAALAVRARAGIFAGAPVRVSGRDVGALVVIRSSSAPLTAGSIEALEELARVVGTQLEMRLEAARLGDSLLLRSDEIDHGPQHHPPPSGRAADLRARQLGLPDRSFRDPGDRGCTRPAEPRPGPGGLRRGRAAGEGPSR